jgi:hypothetical protein
LNAGISPGPSRNVQSRTATRPLPTATSAPASGPVAPLLPHRDDGQHAHDTDGDDRGLEHPRRDETQGETFVLPLDDGVQGDRGADARQGVDHVEGRGEDHLAVRARADDVVGVRQHRSEQ